MNDLLEQIAIHEDLIAQQWVRDIRSLSSKPYQRLEDTTLLATVHRSCQALLHVMQTGDTASMTDILRRSAQNRIASGVSYGETVAVWLLYRQAVQAALRDVLNEPESWEQLVDRVDAALDWVFAVLQEVYQESGQ